jgi:hypothetical protein
MQTLLLLQCLIGESVFDSFFLQCFPAMRDRCFKFLISHDM